MEYKSLYNLFQIPALGFGTWRMGGTTTRNSFNDDIKDIQAIRYAISQGLINIDTAEMYAGGYSETLLGKAIEGVPRENLFLSSKVRGDNCSYKAVKNACYNSLKRVGTDYFDLYYIHWRVSSFQLKDTMKALNELVDEGKIKHIGVSNFSVESLREAQKYSKYPIVANQVHLNLIYREVEVSGLLDYCQQNDIMLVAWRPLEYGDFQNSENTQILEKLSKKYNKTPFQIALRWLLDIENVVTLFKSSNPLNIDENLGSLGWNLDPKDHRELTKHFPNQKYISNAVPLG